MRSYSASIVIPTYNKSARLALTMVSLMNIAGIEESQVIIINDGSTDNTLEILSRYERYKNIRIISITNGGRSVARNIGIQEAESDIVIFCDDDMLLSRDYIKAHIEAHKRRPNIISHGSIYNLPYVKFFADPATGEMVDGRNVKSSMLPYIITPDKILNRFETIIQQSKLGKFESDIQELLQWDQQQVVREYGWIGCTGGNVSIERELLMAIGGFDSKLGQEWGCEDLELGYRLHLVGIPTVLNHQSINYHLCHYRDNSASIHNKALNYFYLKHKSNKIKALGNYFNGDISNLVQWATQDYYSIPEPEGKIK